MLELQTRNILSLSFSPFVNIFSPYPTSSIWEFLEKSALWISLHRRFLLKFDLTPSPNDTSYFRRGIFLHILGNEILCSHYEIAPVKCASYARKSQQYLRLLRFGLILPAFSLCTTSGTRAIACGSKRDRFGLAREAPSLPQMTVCQRWWWSPTI